LACALAALALIAVSAPAAPAVAAKGKAKTKHHRVFKFGSRALGPGARGKDVRILQRALTRLGVATPTDGAYGKGTMQSVKTFEAVRGWPIDGIVSKKDAKRIEKLLAKAVVPTSGTYFVQGYYSPTMTLASRKAGSAKVKAVDLGGNVVQTLDIDFSGAESKSVAWNGMTASAGIAPEGNYELKLGDPGTSGATVTGGQTEAFAMYLHAFPLPGAHSFGGPGSRFGAPRAGHVHQGQDIAAACGEPEVVSETGQVRVNAYQASGAGYYVVIHGSLTGTDYVYMHLRAASTAPVGYTASAGQVIGNVGATGDAEGCHLHFERWSAPGWFVGGAAYDPLPELQYWDSYS
jgi:peptidoglycan hydrolase-like protein with peptidoglycan-binding domain